MNPDAELLAALKAVVQFIDRAIEARQELADAIRAGRPLSRAELEEVDARLRVTQLAGLVRPH